MFTIKFTVNLTVMLELKIIRSIMARIKSGIELAGRIEIRMFKATSVKTNFLPLQVPSV